MSWPSEMHDSDRSHAEKMIEDAAASVAEMKKMLLGNGTDEGIFTRLSHLERTDRETSKRLDRLEDKVRGVRDAMGGTEDPSVTKARLRMVAEGLVALAAVAALIMQFVGG